MVPNWGELEPTVQAHGMGCPVALDGLLDVLLLQYPLTVAWTRAEYQSIACWYF